MKRTLCTGALLVLITSAAACGFRVFEDVGTDPHPPTVEMIGIAIFVPPPPETPAPEPPPAATATGLAAAPLRGRSISWNSGGFSLNPGELFQVGLAYSDAGADIVKVRLRDRDGSTNSDLVFPDSTYFPGTTGKGFGPLDGMTLIGIAGNHRLELWAEDSHGSRSEKIEFVVNLTF